MKNPRLLIEEWLPATAIGIECIRERSTGQQPPHARLHVWWARRPLAASRAAVLASLLPADFDHAIFDRMLGFTERTSARNGKIITLPGSEAAVAAQGALDSARERGTKIPNPHGPRAFRMGLQQADLAAANDAMREVWGEGVTVLDPMAGGGSIPFEALRLGIDAYANEYNPVATTVLMATLDYPVRFGSQLAERTKPWTQKLREKFVHEMVNFFPKSGPMVPHTYLFARTVPCPDTDGNPPTPLVPDWHVINTGSREIVVEPVVTNRDKGEWTVRVRAVGTHASQLGRAPAPTYQRGKGTSLFAKTSIPADYIKAKARAGEMGAVLYAVVFKTSGGLEFRTPSEDDIDAIEAAADELARRRKQWEAAGIIPIEGRVQGDCDRSFIYGLTTWAGLFSPRQLLGFGVLVEELRALRPLILEREGEETGKAINVLLAFMIDKFANWNAALSSWNTGAQTARSVFDRHDFSFKPTFCEMAPTNLGSGLDWAMNNVLDAYTGLCALPRAKSGSPTIAMGSATNLPSIRDGSVTAVVVDPPYDDNVQYSELADFFYVWLKRTVGWIYPEWYASYLCEYEEEAVVNISRHRATVPPPGNPRARSSAAKAREDARTAYRDLMAKTFTECRRVLRDDGVLTVMFTHKKQEAWEALFSAIIDADFQINAAWPIRTEGWHSLHQARKNSAESTVILVARKRIGGGTGYFDAELRREIVAAAQTAAERLQAQGLKPVDQLVGSFGPAMGVFSRYDQVRTDTGEPVRVGAALDLASDAVTAWRVEQLAARGIDGVEAEGRFVLMCWDVLGAGEFRFNEAKLLGHAVGMNVDELVAAGLVSKEGEKIKMLSAKQRRRDRAFDHATAVTHELKVGAHGRRKADTLKVHPNDSSFRTALDACHALALRYLEGATEDAGIGAARGLLSRQGWTRESGVARLMEALVHAAPLAVRHPGGKDSAAEKYPEFRAWHALLSPLFGLEAPDWSESDDGVLSLDLGFLPLADAEDAVSENAEGEGDEEPETETEE